MRGGSRYRRLRARASLRRPRLTRSRFRGRTSRYAGFKRRRMMSTTRRAIRPRTMKPSVYAGAPNAIATVTDYRGGTRVVHTEYLMDLITCQNTLQGIGNYSTSSFPFTQALDQNAQNLAANPAVLGRYYAPAGGGQPVGGVVIPLNAGMIAAWLGQIARNYELFKFNKLCFYYRSTSGTNAQVPASSGGNPTGVGLGTVMMAVQYDEYNPLFPDAKTMQLQEGCTVGVPYQNLKLDVLALKTNKALPLRHLYVRAPISPNGSATNACLGDVGTAVSPIGGAAQDLRFSDLGALTIAYKGFQTNANSMNLGEIWCEYDVTLFKPLAGPALAGSGIASGPSQFFTTTSSPTPQPNSMLAGLGSSGNPNLSIGGLNIGPEGNLVFSELGWYHVVATASVKTTASADPLAICDSTQGGHLFTVDSASFVVVDATNLVDETAPIVSLGVSTNPATTNGGHMGYQSSPVINAQEVVFFYNLYVKVIRTGALIGFPPPANGAYLTNQFATGAFQITCTVDRMPNNFGTPLGL